MGETNFDWDRPIPWEPGGFSPNAERDKKQRTGMARWPAWMLCRHCGELLAKKNGGLTPQGHSLGWLLRGYGPYCYFCNLDAWQAWKRGLFHGLTDQNGW